MKKFLLAVFALIIVSATFAQKSLTSPSNNVQMKKAQTTGREAELAPENTGSMVRTLSHSFIGTTWYDLQTNGSLSNRVVAHNDGTFSAIWTTKKTGAGTRGTGYNYFNGNSWINSPTSTDRIETANCGWGTIASVGDAEIVVSHNGLATGGGLIVSICPQKGTNNWTHTLLQGPALNDGAGHTSTCLLWPNIATSGNTVHVIACTDNDDGFLYEGIHICLLYYRGTYANGAITWEEPRIVGGLTSNEIKNFNGDAYALAAKGDNVAILYANNYSDVFLWKSTDNGVNFTKTVIFEHPYPAFDESTTLVVDTPYVADGSCALALDDNGTAHVAFSVTRLLNDSVGDDKTSWFPYVAGLVYWNENQAPFMNAGPHTLDPDTLVAAGYKVFFRDDLNNDGGAYWAATEAGVNVTTEYGVTLVTMPQLVAQNGKVYMVYTELLDWPFMDVNNSPSPKYYRGVFGCKSTDNGNTWSDASWLSYNKDCYYLNDWSWVADTENVYSNAMGALYVDGENVFPAISRVVNDQVVITWQQDYFAGSKVKEDASANESSIYYLMMNPDSIGIYNNVNEVWQGIWIDPTGISNEVISGMKIYPNPASEAVNVTFSSEEASNAVVSVMNLMGQTVYTTNVNIQEGYNMVNVPVNQLRAGVYMVNIKTNKGTSTQKLIVK